MELKIKKNLIKLVFAIVLANSVASCHKSDRTHTGEIRKAKMCMLKEHNEEDVFEKVVRFSESAFNQTTPDALPYLRQARRTLIKRLDALEACRAELNIHSASKFNELGFFHHEGRVERSLIMLEVWLERLRSEEIKQKELLERLHASLTDIRRKDSRFWKRISDS